MVELSWIPFKLRPYAQNAYKTMIVPISVINEIFNGYDYGLRVFTKEEDIQKSYDAFCTAYDENVSLTEYIERFYIGILSVDNPTKFHSTILASSMLGINILDWEWDNSGVNVIIKYTDKK